MAGKVTEAELQRLKEELRAEILADLKDHVRVVSPPRPRPTVWNDIRAEAERRLEGKCGYPTRYQVIMAISTIIRAALGVTASKLLREEHRERAFEIARTILNFFDGDPPQK